MNFLTHERNVIDISDYIKTYFFSRSGKLNQGLYSLWLGCDSSYRRNGQSEYVTAVCLRLQKGGVHVLHKKEMITGRIKPNPNIVDPVAKKNLIFNMTLERLWQEVLQIEKVIVHLKEEGILYYKNPEDYMLSAYTSSIADIVVHVDFNDEEQHLSHNLTSASVSYFAGLGIRAIKKPDAFAATYAAHGYLK